MHRLSIGRRGQILTWDLIFGVIIFFLAFALSIQMWETAYSELRHTEETRPGHADVVYPGNRAAEKLRGEGGLFGSR